MGIEIKIGKLVVRREGKHILIADQDDGEIRIPLSNIGELTEAIRAYTLMLGIPLPETSPSVRQLGGAPSLEPRRRGRPPGKGRKPGPKSKALWEKVRDKIYIEGGEMYVDDLTEYMRKKKLSGARDPKKAMNILLGRYKSVFVSDGAKVKLTPETKAGTTAKRRGRVPTKDNRKLWEHIRDWMRADTAPKTTEEIKQFVINKGLTDAKRLDIAVKGTLTRQRKFFRYDINDDNDKVWSLKELS